MVTVTLCLLSGAAFVADQATRDLAKDAHDAIKNSNVTIDYVARVIRAPRQKLSDQLHGKAPFTLFCRLANHELIAHSDFWPYFLELRAERFHRSLVSADLGRVVAGVERVIACLAPAPPASVEPTVRHITRRSIQLPVRSTAAPSGSHDAPSRRAVAL